MLFELPKPREPAPSEHRRRDDETDQRARTGHQRVSDERATRKTEQHGTEQRCREEPAEADRDTRLLEPSLEGRPRGRSGRHAVDHRQWSRHGRLDQGAAVRLGNAAHVLASQSRRAVAARDRSRPPRAALDRASAHIRPGSARVRLDASLVPWRVACFPSPPASTPARIASRRPWPVPGHASLRPYESSPPASAPPRVASARLWRRVWRLQPRASPLHVRLSPRPCWFSPPASAPPRVASARLWRRAWRPRPRASPLRVRLSPRPCARSPRRAVPLRVGLSRSRGRVSAFGHMVLCIP